VTRAHDDAAFRLEPGDELTHLAGAEPTYNESFYANGWDLRQRFGAWMRVGNRVNEGYAELSLCAYLPDGRLACQFLKPPITANDAFRAGGLTLAVEEPFARATASYDGEVMLLDDPAQLRDPKRVFESAPRAQASLSWQMTTISPVHGGEPVRDDQPTLYGRDFSLGHFNQHTRVVGQLAVGASRLELDGYGWRDHSWGPRTWQAIHFYRLFIGNFGDDAGFMILKITDRAGLTRRVGVWLADGAYEDVQDVDVMIDWTPEKEPSRVRLGVRTARRRTILEGRVLSLAPLRNRREVDGRLVTSRIAEAFTEFTWEGRTGLGICEFIEVLEGGVPAGYPT
jgi:hypothetical protein